jgi:hypothetical protein
VPAVASLNEFHKAIAHFAVAELGLVIEPRALAAARRSLDESGLLLLGEVHGVCENPLLIRELLIALDLRSLALEWFDGLAPTIRDVTAGGVLTDHDELWWGDGRITAGHLAMLAERAAAGPMNLTMFDGVTGAGWNWSQRDEAMARRIMVACAPDSRTLVVAGNAHTPTSETEHGIPMGARLAMQRPGVSGILIRYGGGRFYNLEPRQFRNVAMPQDLIRLYEHNGQLILDLPVAHEAVVPQQVWSPRPRPPR